MPQNSAIKRAYLATHILVFSFQAENILIIYFYMNSLYLSLLHSHSLLSKWRLSSKNKPLDLITVGHLASGPVHGVNQKWTMIVSLSFSSTSALFWPLQIFLVSPCPVSCPFPTPSLSPLPLECRNNHVAILYDVL